MGSLENGRICSFSGLEEEKLDGEKLSKNLSSYFREYCDYTGIHGFKYIGEKRSTFEKICWILIFITSLMVCIAVIYQTYGKWQYSPVIVNFDSEEKNIYEIPFPAVTLCQEIKISRRYFNYSESLRKIVIENQELNQTELKNLQYMSMLCGDGREFKKQIPNISTVGEDFYSFLENGSAGFFRQCSWMGKKYNCDKIFRPIITDEGLCMTFNMLNDEQIYRNNVFPPPINRKLPNDYAFEEWSADHGYGEEAGVESYPRRALLSGSSNALIVNMEVALDDLDYACSNFQGFQVVLHKAIRFPTVTEHYFRVPLSKSVIVAISPAQIVTSDDVKYYSPRKRKCFLQGEKTLMYFKNYTQYNCKLECLTNYTLDVCGCVSFYMPREKYTPICGNGNLTCISFVKRYMDIAGLRRSLDKETNIRNFSKILSCDCLPMCTMVEYNTEITEIDYDWYKKYESIGNKTERDEKYSSSQLVIYFKSGHYIPCVRHELYGHLDFLANVGGLLGLFVGFSLISLLEILYFVSVRIICNMKLYQHWYGE